MARTSLSFGKFIRAGVTGGVIAAAVNLVILFTAQAVNGGPLQIMRPGAASPDTLPFFMVLAISIVAGLVAGLLYPALGRFLANPTPIFLVVSVLVFILFFFPPLSSPTPVAVWSLELMHLVAAVVILWFVLGAATPGRG